VKAWFCIAVPIGALVLGGCGGGGSDSSASTAESPAKASAYVLGGWRGTLHQTGMPPFAISAEIRSLEDPQQNRVSYSAIRCSGNWTYLGRKEGSFRFREVIDRGAGGSCKGVGQVSLTPITADTARYEFRGAGIVSRGLLHRDHRP
jgi:hypothetical protein